MILRVTTGLLALCFLAGCGSSNTAKRETLREMTARYASENPTGTSSGPAPPAEGPEESGDRSMDPGRNPALLPSPLLRQSAAGSL